MQPTPAAAVECPFFAYGLGSVRANLGSCDGFVSRDQNSRSANAGNRSYFLAHSGGC
jgi:hypothetical protein